MRCMRTWIFFLFITFDRVFIVQEFFWCIFLYWYIWSFSNQHFPQLQFYYCYLLKSLWWDHFSFYLHTKLTEFCSSSAGLLFKSWVGDMFSKRRQRLLQVFGCSVFVHTDIKQLLVVWEHKDKTCWQNE